MNELTLFHSTDFFFFFFQAGLTGLLQKEELQLGVDAANRAAQQYQQSKEHQKLLQQKVAVGCHQKDESIIFVFMWRYIRFLSDYYECSLST